MGTPLEIGTEISTNDAPMPRLVKYILFQAIQDKVDEVVFALDEKSEARVKAEKERLMKEGKLNEALSYVHPKTFSISFQTKGRPNFLAPVPGHLFGPAMRILLNAADIPHEEKGAVAGELQTSKPASVWQLISQDLTARVELKRMPQPLRE